MKLRHTKKVLAGAAAVVLAVTGTAVGLAAVSGSARDGAPVQFSPRTGAITPISGSPSAAVSALAARFPMIRSASVSSKVIPSEDGSPGTTVLAAVIQANVASMNGADIMPAEWEAELLGGAIADSYAATPKLGAVKTVETTVFTPDGQSRYIGGGLGNVVRNQVFSALPTTLASIVASRAPSLGLSDAHVSYIRALSPAIVISATSTDPAETLQAVDKSDDGPLNVLLDGPPTRYEGVFLEVKDANGSPVYINATAARAGAGLSWIRPDLEGNRGGMLRLH